MFQNRAKVRNLVGSSVLWLTVLVVSGLTCTASAADWPQYLGPDRNSTSPEKGLLRSWPEKGPEVLWTVAVGKGYGGPVVKDGKVYLLDRDDKVGDNLRCFDLASGNELWNFAYDAPGRVSFPGSRSVPTVDGHYVYSCGHNGDLYCIELNTHKPVWNKNVWTDFGGKPTRIAGRVPWGPTPVGRFPVWAITQCPLIYGDLLLIASQAPDAGVVAYNKLTGDVKWKTPSLGYVGYVSPAIVKVDGKDHVVMITPSTNPFRRSSPDENNPGKVVGIEPLTGKILWEYNNWHCHISVPSAVDAGENRVLVAGGYELGAVMIKVEKKADGSYGTTELFKTEEFGDQTKPPILHNGYFYAQYGTNSRNDGLTCMSMDGEIMWKTKRDPGFNKGSMVLVDGVILATDGRKTLYLIEPDPSEFKLLASAETLDAGQNWAPLAFSNGKLLVRDQNQMKCVVVGANAVPAPGSKMEPAKNIVITADDVTVEKIGTSIPVSKIGEPVSAVNLSEPRWVQVADAASSYAVVEGSMLPIDPEGFPINFRVILPASWSRRAIHRGGRGNNGIISVQAGGPRRFGGPGDGGRDMSHQGIAQYGSDSGHQAGRRGRFGPPGTQQAGGDDSGDAWALNDEAIKNFGYMQMKKTHDAAMVIMERVYGERPRFNYYIGTSQGGREALTVAQRYPEDYDGIIADVPVVNFSSLMLAPVLIRIQEISLASYVPPAKANAVRNEFIRQADKLDGLADGIINNYMAARQLFDVTDGIGTTDPWAALRAPNNEDPNPQDTSISAKLTDAQIKTLEFVYSRYKFATPLVNGVQTFGMWVPNTDPTGTKLIDSTRYRGQEGAAENAPLHTHGGTIGVTGFLMRDLSANSLDYVEGGRWNDRRQELSVWLDSTDPDLSAFYKRGGKMIVTIGTNDTIASPGAQLDYYQSVIDEMGQETVDAFARFFVIPQTDHYLRGRNHSINGDGEAVPVEEIASQFDRQSLLMAWVERNEAPDKTLVVTSGNRRLPLCSYPNYPRYVGGPVNEASSYESTAPQLY